MSNAFIEDAFQQVIAVNFGGGVAWVLINVEVGGISPVPPPPSFGTFDFTLPNGTSLLDKQQITKSQGTTTTPNNFFFPWNNLVTPPTQSNYKITRPDHPGNALFSWSVTDTLRGYPNDPAFPPPDKSFWYSTAAKAAAAAALLPSISDDNYFASLSDFLAVHFTNNFPIPLTWSVQEVKDPTTVSGTTFNMKFLVAVPAKLTTFNLNVGIPIDSNAIGWASIFTPSKTRKTVRRITDLVGNADQSVQSFGSAQTEGGGGGHSFVIITTGKQGAGTISVDGNPGTVPGLPPSAPLPGG